MAKLTINGAEHEVPDGLPLVEAIKKSGVWISNLCYIDGLPPYAGCRTCLVEVEGARGLQLSCTMRVTDGMVVNTDNAVVREARQAVISIINANHSDRCLTCHRRLHCMPGDICLRDSVVSHRCLTCAKNYRCELQRTNEMADMANYEPWVGEDRTYYQSEQPEADRANPFLEFDPQMCIICTRCVRTCDEVRHTGALTLAGRGPTARIAFGAGGPIHDSNCDFCGACIDVCPTATLLEKPNKWIAKSEEWVSTTCNSCSVGCTLSMGVRNGRVVMVKPDRLNPISESQICVRGRFHYDAVRPRDRLARHLVAGAPSTLETAVGAAADGLSKVVKEHGPAAVGVLVAPWATNEEAFLAARLARDVIGTPNLDSTAGPVFRAVAEAVRDAFGTDVLPADLSKLAQASTIVVLADDLESSHNIAALRVKDAVVRNGASLVVIASRYGEVCDFIDPPPAGSMMPSPQQVHTFTRTGVWLRPAAGGEVATAAALGRVLAAAADTSGLENVEAASAGPAEVPGVSADDLSRASAVLQPAATSGGSVAVVYAPNPSSPALAAAGARAAANLALLCAGERAAESLYVLPADANTNGLRDMDIAPGANGLDADRMPAGVRALLVVGDNPAMLSRAQDETRAALEKLDCLVVVDSLQTETAKRAHVVLADLPLYGKEGTQTNADRRIVRRARAQSAIGDQRDALELLSALGSALADRLGKSVSLPEPEASAVQDAIAAEVPGYATLRRAWSGMTRVLAETPSRRRLQPVSAPALPATNGKLALTTSRTLFTSLEGAALGLPDADKLGREVSAVLNPADAARLRLNGSGRVAIANGSHSVTLAASTADAIPEGSVFLPLYLEGGVVNRLLSASGEASPLVTVTPA